MSVWPGAEGKQVERGMSTADIVRNNAGTHEPLPAAKLVREVWIIGKATGKSYSTN